MTRLTDSRRARNSASETIGARRRLASRPSRRRCFLASRRVEPVTELISSSSERGSRTLTTVFCGSSSLVPAPSPARRRRRRRNVPLPSSSPESSSSFSASCFSLPPVFLLLPPDAVVSPPDWPPFDELSSPLPSPRRRRLPPLLRRRRRDDPPAVSSLSPESSLSPPVSLSPGSLLPVLLVPVSLLSVSGSLVSRLPVPLLLPVLADRGGSSVVVGA